MQMESIWEIYVPVSQFHEYKVWASAENNLGLLTGEIVNTLQGGIVNTFDMNCKY